jgi:hypothetical protein
MENQAKKKLIIIVIAVAIVLLVGAVVMLVWKGLPSPQAIQNAPGSSTGQASDGMNGALGEEAALETQKLIDEVKEAAKNIDEGSGFAGQKVSQVVTFTKTEVNGTTTSTSTEQAVVVAPDSNPISIETGEVLTRDGGKEADNTLQAGDPNAPIQSEPIDPSKLPESAVKLSMSPTSVTPKSFTVKAKQAVALSVTAESSIEIFKFDDPSLAAVALGLKPGETRVITFNAPDKPGNYVFYSDFAGHRATGAEGLMIVQ